MTLKAYLVASLILFLVIFNLGFVFHDLLMGAWFAEHLKGLARDEYIIPLIALSYLIYSFIHAFFYPHFYAFSKISYLMTGVVYGGLMGVLYDGLEGGLIEYATMTQPFAVFLADTPYHIAEGILSGMILAVIYKKFGLKKGIPQE